MVDRLLFHTTVFVGAVAIATLAVPRAVTAQTRGDSSAVARLIVSRALQDARRQDSRIRSLAFLPSSHPATRHEPRTGARLLELATDALLVPGGAVCPWHVGGHVEPRLELVVRNLTFSGARATADVLLRCSAGVVGEGGFGWFFTYHFTRTARTWSIKEVIERAIT